MAKQQLINRAKYKDIKRYDHNQMERFARSLYESGFKDGAVQARPTQGKSIRQWQSRNPLLLELGVRI